MLLKEIQHKCKINKFPFFLGIIFFYSWCVKSLFASAIIQPDTVHTDKENVIIFGFNAAHLVEPDFFYKDGVVFTTSLTLSLKQHFISAGPIWWFDKNRDVSIFRGGIISYHYYPCPSKKNINFHFLYDLTYTYEKQQWDTLMDFYPELSKSQTYNATVNIRWQSLANQVGYGFTLNIYNGFYLNQSFSFGIEFYNYRSKTEVHDAPVLSGEYTTGSIFSRSNASSFLKIGIGYQFE